MAISPPQNPNHFKSELLDSENIEREQVLLDEQGRAKAEKTNDLYEETRSILDNHIPESFSYSIKLSERSIKPAITMLSSKSRLPN